MFDSIRSHRRWLMIFMLVLIFPSFVFFGIQGYNSFISDEGALAKVGGTPITQPEFDAALRERTERMRQALGENFDPKIFDTAEGRAAVLDSLILDRALTQEANRSNVVVSNGQLRDVIGGIPAFQEDGKFSMDRYRAYLASQGLSDVGFEERVRQDLRKQLLMQAVAGSTIVPKQVSEKLERILLEQREVRLLTLPIEAYLPKVKVDDAQVADFYEKNRRLFETPENVKVEYVVLDVDAIAPTVTVAEADVRSYYEQNKARYGTEEQRRASHILITAEGRDKAVAKKEAEDLLAQLKANPKDFAKLAREHSKDPGSASQGGDLGFFGRGMMTKPFEDAAAQLKPGETSGVVESDFGYHIIRLTEIKPAQIRPLDEVKPEIEKELRTQQGQKRFAEAAEQFTNLVYEQSDSLKPAVDKLGLKPRTADQVTRAGLPAAPNERQIFTPRVIEALFSDDSIKNKRNTQAIEIGPNTLVAARIVEYRPAAVRPLDDLKAAIRQRLERQQAAILAREAGQTRLTELRTNPSDAGFAPPLVVSRRAPKGMPPVILNEVLRAPSDTLPVYVGADVEGPGYVIAHVLASKPGDALDAAQREAQSRALGQQMALSDELAYSEGLRTRYNVEVVRPEFRRERPAPVDSKTDAKAAAEPVKAEPAKK